MSKNHRSWYLLGYDIRQPRRLQRVHRYLKGEAIAAQKSLFLFHGTPTQRDQLLQQLNALIDRQQDDVRIYPIGHPEQLWLGGNTPPNLTTNRSRRRTAAAPGNWLQRIRQLWHHSIDRSNSR